MQFVLAECIFWNVFTEMFDIKDKSYDYLHCLLSEISALSDAKGCNRNMYGTSENSVYQLIEKRIRFNQSPCLDMGKQIFRLTERIFG